VAPDMNVDDNDFEEDSDISVSEMICFEDGDIECMSPIEKLISYCKKDTRF
jgi:hypothetical protein